MTQLQAPAPPRLGRRMSYGAFLKWEGDTQHVEWVDGEVVVMSPVTEKHSLLSCHLIALLQVFVEHYDLGAILADPFQMKTGPDLPGRAPDILFVARRNRRRLHRTFLQGPGDAVVEIISPGSETSDRVEKFAEYEQGGVREYWILDPQQETADFYRRGRSGRLTPVPIDQHGVFRSRVIRGLWLRVDWLWRRPAMVEVMREWELI